MTLVELAGYLLRSSSDELRWRYIAEFLEEHRHEDRDVRLALLAGEPPTTGSNRWDVFLAALAEHLAEKDDHGPPAWAGGRRLGQFWFPFDTAAARADALVHAPASFAGRGIFISPAELSVA